VNHSAEVDADSDLSEGDSYTAFLEDHLAEVQDELKTLKSGHVASLEKRLEQVENELKELKSGE
jgi:cell division protein FtsL